MKEKMNAIVANAYGNADVLQFTQVKKPQLADKEVLVKVFAAAATTADGMMLSGKPYFARLFVGLRRPKHAIPGTAFAGVVESVGKQVTKFKAGDRVFGETTLSFGSNAEFVAIPENGVILPVPENLPFNEAATLCDGHLTSYNFLTQVVNVKPGQKILINGASGSLGTAAVQLAKHFGAHVTAVCGTQNTGLVKSLGADKVIDYKKTDFTSSNQTYDIIFDTVGKSSFTKTKRILSKNGKYISPVLKFLLLGQMLKSKLIGRKKAIFSATGLNSDDQLRNLLKEVLEIYKNGHLKTVIDRQFPLEKVAEAHRYIATGHKKGNVIIRVEHKSH